VVVSSYDSYAETHRGGGVMSGCVFALAAIACFDHHTFPVPSHIYVQGNWKV